MLKKMKNNKKGFTKVELIVVLVILAILAAMLIPALTGYIDKAKRKAIVAETRQAVMAAQTIVDEKYGVLATDATADAITISKDAKADTVDKDTNKAVIATSSIEGLAEVKGKVTAATVVSGKVTSLTYEVSGKQCVYTKDAVDGTDGAYNVTK